MLQQFLFETVRHLIVREFSSSRMTRQIHRRIESSVSGRLGVADYHTESGAYVRFDNARPDSEKCCDLWGECTDYRVNSSSCALHGAMRDILRRNRSVLRHVSRRANRPSLNARSGYGECEND